MEEALKLGAKRIIIRGDSELVIKQMKGEYKVRHPDMKPLYAQAQDLLAQFDEAKIEHNLRGKNALADKLANLAMDRKSDIHDVDGDSGPSEIDVPSATGTKAGDRLACARCGCEIDVRKPTSIRPHQQKPFICQCGNKMS
jgi:hypothetical protein